MAKVKKLPSEIRIMIQRIVNVNVFEGCSNTINELFTKIDPDLRDRLFYKTILHCVKELKKVYQNDGYYTEMYEKIVKVVVGELTGKDVISKDFSQMFDEVLKTAKFLHPTSKHKQMVVNPLQEFCLELIAILELAPEQKIEFSDYEKSLKALIKNTPKKRFLIGNNNVAELRVKLNEPNRIREGKITHKEEESFA